VRLPAAKMTFRGYSRSLPILTFDMAHNFLSAY